jgi:hypothetical protein
MTVIKKFIVAEMKCLDDGSQDQALLIGCPNRTILSLVFDRKKATHTRVHELEGLMREMGLASVEVQTDEPQRPRVIVERVSRNRPHRR